MSSIKGVIFDRDGTLIKHVPYLSDCRDVSILPTVVDALTVLKANDVQCFIATNQSGIGRGFFSEAEYRQVEGYIHRLFHGLGIPFAQTYFCPYHPTEGVQEYRKQSSNRKPNSGMLMQVMQDYALSVDELIMVGDSVVDIQAAKNIGMRSVHVGTGLPYPENTDVMPNFFADSLLQAVTSYILTV